MRAWSYGSGIYVEFLVNFLGNVFFLTFLFNFRQGFFS